MNNFFVRIGVLSLFVLLQTNAVNAQSSNVEKVGAYMTQEMSFLNMTATQAEQIYQINFQAANAMERLGALKKTDQTFDQVLSPQQVTVYHENVDFLRNLIREEYGTNDSF
ncbi:MULTISPECIES: hypothetical protein [Sphingobacterium]|uniref:hypothetical protein n=1 Tax=Sphingobacterium TaxID=28453 RepID=UPI00257BDA9A|nr:MULTISPECIES: hypothetical protein [Sphingobacterium]